MNNRRQILRNLSVAAATLAGARGLFAATATASGKTYEVTHTDAEWKKMLSADEYLSLRQNGTERAHSSPLSKEDRSGIYACRGCELPLYFSDKKFYSSTGWPSFWAPIPGAVDEAPDTSLGMVRTEISCHRCGSHLGHVFQDGPPPTGLRYCMNGLSLDFKPSV